MIDTSTLKFPSGEFTHTELAKLNGKTNQQVWTRYQLAIKNGQILKAGERKTAGKGKPSLLWKLNPNYVAPVVPVTPAVTPATAPAATAPATPVAPAATVPTEPVVQTAGDSVVLPTEAEIEAAVGPATPAAEVLPPVAPAAPADTTPAVETVIATAVEAAAPAADTTMTEALAAQPIVAAAIVEAILPPAPAAEAPVAAEPVTATVEVARVENQTVIPEGVTQLDELCPVCQNKLFSVPDATGIMVWCAQPATVCKANENPAFHADTAAKAAAGLIERWTKLMSPVAA